VSELIIMANKNTDTVVMPRTQLPVGVTPVGPMNVPLTIIAAGIVIDKTNWTDPNVLLSCQYDISLDNGQSWIPQGGFANEPGGGSEVFFTFPLPDPTNNQRRVRAALTVSGGVCDISASVRLLDGTEPKGLP